MQYIKNLIIGAGVSGLSIAKSLSDSDYLILEKENEYGGYCRTTKRNDYVWDYAGHFYHFKNSNVSEYFTKHISDNEIMSTVKNTKIFYKNKFIDYPFQKNIHQLSKNEFIDCLYDLYFREEDNDANSFIEMLYSKFGKSITNKFLKPYNEKLYACDLSILDIEAMGRFFPYADIDEIIGNMKKKNNVSYNQNFIYPKEGAIKFIDILLNDIDKNKIIYNSKIQSIDTFSSTVYLDDYQIKYDTLYSTIPLNNFLELSKIEHSFNCTYNKVLAINIGFNTDVNKELKDVHWIYVPDKSINFYRVGFYNHILKEPKLSVYIEIGFSHDKSINYEKEFLKCIEGLKLMNIIDENTIIVDKQFIEMDPAYVHISKNTIKDIKELKNKLSKQKVFLVGRYGSWTYCSIEDCILEAIKTVEYVKNEKISW